MAISVGDIGVPIDFELGENISSSESRQIIIRHQKSRNDVKTFTAIVKPASTTAIRYVTANAADIPRGGVWEIQAHVVEGGVDRLSTIQTFTATEAL